MTKRTLRSTSLSSRTTVSAVVIINPKNDKKHQSTRKKSSNRTTTITTTTNNRIDSMDIDYNDDNNSNDTADDTNDFILESNIEADNNNDNDDDDDDTSYVPDEIRNELHSPTSNNKRRRTTTSSTTSKSKINNNNNNSSSNTAVIPFECTNCHKTFKSSLGLQYHINEYVCQPELRPLMNDTSGVQQQQQPIRKGRRKIINNPTVNIDHTDLDTNVTIIVPPPRKEYNKIRGKIHDRTCPDCQRIFTSITGMQYHRDKLVCKQENNNKNSNSDVFIPFDTLSPGQTFITPYGVVEVIHDNRAIPFVPSSDLTFTNEIEESKQPTRDTNSKIELQKRMKLYNSAMAKRDSRDTKHMMNVAVVSLSRRILLQRIYENEHRNHHHQHHHRTDFKATTTNTNTHAELVHQAYRLCRDVPNQMAGGLKRKVLDDPSAPASFYPDRIVECKLLPDQRLRYIGSYVKKDDPISGHNFTLLDGVATSINTTNRIYIQRRLLVTPYSIDSERYYCPLCYQCFTSKPGYKYHVESESCTKRSNSKAIAITEYRTTIASRAQQLVDQYDDPNSTIRFRFGEDTTKLNSTITSHVQADSVISSKIPEIDSDGIAIVPLHSNVESNNDDVTVDVTTLVSPDVVLAQLESELYRALGRMIGPIYPSVYTALGFRKPAAKPKKKRKVSPATVTSSVTTVTQGPTNSSTSNAFESAVSNFITASQASVEEYNSLHNSQIPVIDIRPLVQEVDAGRYPSMKRYICDSTDNNKERDIHCAICKKSETERTEQLLQCNFCHQVEHYTCTITKFIIQYPEVIERNDYMCHNCIGVIVTRRTRAERRRLEKLLSINHTDPSLLNSIALQDECLISNSTNNSSWVKHRDMISLLNGVVSGREYECVAVQGRRLDELNILLRDASSRLSLMLDSTDMNTKRISMLETMTHKNDKNDFEIMIQHEASTDNEFII